MAEEKQEELHFRDELFEELMHGKQQNAAKSAKNTQVLEMPKDISTMNVGSIPQNYTVRMEKIAEQMFSTGAARSWIYCKLSPYFKKEEQRLEEASKLTKDAKKVQAKIDGLTDGLKSVKDRKGIKILSYLNTFMAAINLIASAYKLIKALKEGISASLYPQISFAGNVQLFFMSKNQREIMIDVIKIKAGSQFEDFVQSLADAILAPYMPVILNLCEEILWLTVDVVLLILSLIPKIGTLIKGTAKYAMNAMKTVKTATKFTKIANAANKIRKYAAITIKATDKFFRVTKTGRIITKTAKYAKKIRDVINGTVQVKGARVPVKRIYRAIHDSGACVGALEDAAELIQASVRNLENAIGGARITSSASHFKYDTEEINTQIAGQTNEDLSEALASHDYSISVSSKNGKISLGDNTQQVKEHYENLTLTVLHETISTIMNTVSMTISDIILSETDIGNFLAAARDSIAKAAEEGTSSKQEAKDVMYQEGETEKARFIRYTFKTKELTSKNEEKSTIEQQNLETASYIIKIFNAKDKTIKNSHLTGKERFLSNEDGIIKVLEPSNTEAMKQIAFNFTSKTAESSYWFGQQTIIYNSSMLITKVASGIKNIIEKGIKKDYQSILKGTE